MDQAEVFANPVTDEQLVFKVYEDLLQLHYKNTT